MLRPGSSKLKESEAALLNEIHDFEKQEDKTLHNMEETMRMMSSSTPKSSFEELQPAPPQTLKSDDADFEIQSQNPIGGTGANKHLIQIDDLEEQLLQEEYDALFSCLLESNCFRHLRKVCLCAMI